jgi:hypothetical protein
MLWFWNILLRNMTIFSESMDCLEPELHRQKVTAAFVVGQVGVHAHGGIEGGMAQGFTDDGHVCSPIAGVGSVGMAEPVGR